MNPFVPLRLRQQIVHSDKQGHGTYEDIAIRFGVGLAAVSLPLRLHREVKFLNPCARTGWWPAFIALNDERTLRSIVEEMPGATFSEID